MAGPGIRYFHLSRVLQHYTDLTLAIIPQNDQAVAALQAQLPGVSVMAYTRGEWDSIKQAAQASEVIIVPSGLIADFPNQLANLDTAVVIDGYNPLLAESLAMSAASAAQQQPDTRHKAHLAAIYPQYLLGDFYLCASERQRYWWLGQLEVAGRINPATYQADPSLRNLVDVSPYGLPEEPPQKRKPVIRDVWPGIEADDILLLWGGGLWMWLDPLTAIQAVAQLHDEHPHIKLVFPGTRHPNADMAEFAPTHFADMYAYAQQTGLLDTAVFFGDWVPYADWPDVLLECDIALSLHYETLETSLAFRSRMLEYIWAGLPIITNRGDATSDLVEKYDLGITVQYQNADEAAQAILQIMASPAEERQANFAAAREQLSWQRAARPLIRFCQNPHRAADRQTPLANNLPYYDAETAVRRITELEQLTQAYENGKFMRFMRTMNQIGHRFRHF
ncbi:MAG: glycosyltransferase family 4 protein [Chloroflexi bacterium]|nr:glycosyltransferase family 4 protein [Chloroflexota bacterium]